MVRLCGSLIALKFGTHSLEATTCLNDPIDNTSFRQDSRLQRCQPKIANNVSAKSQRNVTLEDYDGNVVSGPTFQWQKACSFSSGSPGFRLLAVRKCYGLMDSLLRMATQNDLHGRLVGDI